jgi:hypothetical protein
MLGGKRLSGDLLKSRTAGILSLLIICIGVVVAAYIATNNTSPSTATWQIVSQISNKGRQDTTEFSMTDPWRLVWRIDSYTSSLFLVAVYAKNDTGYSVVAEADATDTNSTRGVLLPTNYSGSFVIRVITLDDTEWTLQIQEFTT